MASPSGKLLYLRDRARRRHRRNPAGGARGSAPDSAGPPRNAPAREESVWLARCLFGVAGYLALRWMVVGAGLVDPSGSAELRVWTLGLLVADCLALVAAAFGGAQLMAEGDSREAGSLLAAGSLGYGAVLRLTHAVFASDALTPGERLEAVVFLGVFVTALWSASHALRSRPAR